MQSLTINGKQYDLEFTFAAADEGNLISNMFRVVSGAYFFDHGKENNMAAAMMNGTAEMVGDLPMICKQAFFAGLKEHTEGITYEKAVDLMKMYMTENKISFNVLYQQLKTQMEEDGFFELTGIIEMMQTMSDGVKEIEMAEIKPKKTRQTKTPQDHLKKSTGTK